MTAHFSEASHDYPTSTGLSSSNRRKGRPTGLHSFMLMTCAYSTRQYGLSSTYCIHGSIPSKSRVPPPTGAVTRFRIMVHNLNFFEPVQRFLFWFKISSQGQSGDAESCFKYRRKSEEAVNMDTAGQGEGIAQDGSNIPPMASADVASASDDDAMVSIATE